MDAVKDLADSGKVFVRDGNAVSPPPPPLPIDTSPSPLLSCSSTLTRTPSPVHQPLHKARQEGCAPLLSPLLLPCRLFIAHTRLSLPRLTPCACPTEYVQICRAVAIGFAMMGGIGYLVKLIHVRAPKPSLPLSSPPLERD